MTLSKAKQKLVTSLSSKKNRDKLRLFIAEGDKLVKDLMQVFEVKWIFCSNEWKACNLSAIEHLPTESVVALDDLDDMKSISQLTTPTAVLCVFHQNECGNAADIVKHSDLVIALDSIQDPGNLGTIIRTADWFGVKYVFCSNDTVDVYNPKVVQATMGALARVVVVYGGIYEFLQESKKCGKNLFGTFLNGNNIYATPCIPKNAVIIMGNEGNGVSKSVENIISERLTIPHFQFAETKPESLNVAIATSIVISEFRR